MEETRTRKRARATRTSPSLPPALPPPARTPSPSRSNQSHSQSQSQSQSHRRRRQRMGSSPGCVPRAVALAGDGEEGSSTVASTASASDVVLRTPPQRRRPPLRAHTAALLLALDGVGAPEKQAEEKEEKEEEEEEEVEEEELSVISSDASPTTCDPVLDFLSLGAGADGGVPFSLFTSPSPSPSRSQSFARRAVSSPSLFASPLHPAGHPPSSGSSSGSSAHAMLSPSRFFRSPFSRDSNQATGISTRRRPPSSVAATGNRDVDAVKLEPAQDSTADASLASVKMEAPWRTPERADAATPPRPRRLLESPLAIRFAEGGALFPSNALSPPQPTTSVPWRRNSLSLRTPSPARRRRDTARAHQQQQQQREREGQQAAPSPGVPSELDYAPSAALGQHGGGGTLEQDWLFSFANTLSPLAPGVGAVGEDLETSFLSLKFSPMPSTSHSFELQRLLPPFPSPSLGLATRRSSTPQTPLTRGIASKSSAMTPLSASALASSFATSKSTPMAMATPPQVSSSSQASTSATSSNDSFPNIRASTSATPGHDERLKLSGSSVMRMKLHVTFDSWPPSHTKREIETINNSLKRKKHAAARKRKLEGKEGRPGKSKSARGINVQRKLLHTPVKRREPEEEMKAEEGEGEEEEASRRTAKMNPPSGTKAKHVVVRTDGDTCRDDKPTRTGKPTRKRQRRLLTSVSDVEETSSPSVASTSVLSSHSKTAVANTTATGKAVASNSGEWGRRPTTVLNTTAASSLAGLMTRETAPTIHALKLRKSAPAAVRPRSEGAGKKHSQAATPASTSTTSKSLALASGNSPLTPSTQKTSPVSTMTKGATKRSDTEGQFLLNRSTPKNKPPTPMRTPIAVRGGSILGVRENAVSGSSLHPTPPLANNKNKQLHVPPASMTPPTVPAASLLNPVATTDAATAAIPVPAVAVAVAAVVPKKAPCNCKKSKCLKLYCECFASGGYCDENCNCQGCANTPSNETMRQKAIATRLEKNPNAFKPKIEVTAPAGAVALATMRTPNGRLSAGVSAGGTASASGFTTPISGSGALHHRHAGPMGAAVDGMKMHKHGCHCKKSACQKKYCECFQAGVPCGDNCRCIDCKNQSPYVAKIGSSVAMGAMAAGSTRIMTPRTAAIARAARAGVGVPIASGVPSLMPRRVETPGSGDDLFVSPVLPSIRQRLRIDRETWARNFSSPFEVSPRRERERTERFRSQLKNSRATALLRSFDASQSSKAARAAQISGMKTSSAAESPSSKAGASSSTSSAGVEMAIKKEPMNETTAMTSTFASPPVARLGSYSRGKINAPEGKAESRSISPLSDATRQPVDAAFDDKMAHSSRKSVQSTGVRVTLAPPVSLTMLERANRTQAGRVYVLPLFGETLPPLKSEVSTHVLQFLTNADVYNASLVNRLWSRVTTSDSVWDSANFKRARDSMPNMMTDEDLPEEEEEEEMVASELQGEACGDDADGDAVMA